AWNGEDTYIQKTGIVQDFGVFDTPDAFYFSHEQSFGWLRGALYRHIIRHWMNARVRGFRSDRLKTDRRATHAHEEPANAT
ncbi:transglutaminase, partial [Sulfitobacter sp. 1A12779]